MLPIQPETDDDSWVWTNHHQGSVHLWIKWFDFDGSELTRGFGLEPTRVQLRGQPKQTPKGTRIGSDVYAKDSWFLDRPVPGGRWPSDVILEILPALERAPQLIERVWAAGGNAALVVHAVQRGSQFAVGEQFEVDLLRRLGALRVELGFEAFGGDKTPG